MSTLSAFRSVARIATIASVVGVLSSPVFADDANRSYVLRDLGKSASGAEDLWSHAQSAQSARAQHSGAPRRRPQFQPTESGVNSPLPFAPLRRIGYTRRSGERA